MTEFASRFLPVWQAKPLLKREPRGLGWAKREFFEDLFSNPAYQPFDLTPEQAYLADEASPNRDPFDGLVCAAARALDLPLITRDRAIQEWGGLSTVW